MRLREGRKRLSVLPVRQLERCVVSSGGKEVDAMERPEAPREKVLRALLDRKDGPATWEILTFTVTDPSLPT